MDTLTIVIIATGLSMDSFAVSLANGFAIRNLDLKKSLLIALSFAVFQTIMPVAGWFAGDRIEKYIRDIDHWAAFVLLLFLGGRMIFEGIRSGDSHSHGNIRPLTVITQSFATSIDALAVGLSFSLLGTPLLKPVLIIGAMTFVFSFSALYIGRFFGQKLRRTSEITGGIILIGIGLKILFEHIGA